MDLCYEVTHKSLLRFRIYINSVKGYYKQGASRPLKIVHAFLSLTRSECWTLVHGNGGVHYEHEKMSAIVHV